MVGTSDYRTASQLLKRLLQTFDLNKEKQAVYRGQPSVERTDWFRKLLEDNLLRVEEAKESGIVFTEEIIFYQYNLSEKLPHDAIAVDEAISKGYEKAFRPRYWPEWINDKIINSASLQPQP